MDILLSSQKSFIGFISRKIINFSMLFTIKLKRVSRIIKLTDIDGTSERTYIG